MNLNTTFTDFSDRLLTAGENDLSRRYLDIIMRWIPTGMASFEEWPVRPRCGHFFGGVLWYCQDTVMPAFALAAATSSPEFDPGVAEYSRDELRETALRALRYACFTHDTGPPDCVRPTKSWGRTEPAGKKWGERGNGFFRETNAGRQVANLAGIAYMLRDLLSEEERSMLAAIAEDFLGRFIDMDPRSGVFFDTQMEENAWTAFGLTGAALLLEKHSDYRRWTENIALWMHRAVSKPQDMYNLAAGTGGKPIRELTLRACTTLPDNTAENHGFVHPSYMRSSINLIGQMTVLLNLWDKEIPKAAFHNHSDVYSVLKAWCDSTGTPHAPQGMDWPYINLSGYCVTHGFANLNLHDPEGALLEALSLSAFEKSVRAHGGQIIPTETKKYCHGQQDPAIMKERFICGIAYVYLAHRLLGEGEKPAEEAAFLQNIKGVHTYPHGGTALHVHSKGRNSVSWRNGSMVLPSTGEGLKLIGCARESVLARLKVKGRQSNCQLRTLKVRDGQDEVCVLLEEDLFEQSIRRRVFFASLPDGRSVVWERLSALDAVEIDSVSQGALSIINDPVFGDGEPGRRVYWDGGDTRFVGFAAADSSQDLSQSLGQSRWVNVDDKFGIVYEGTGTAWYRNTHHYEVWHAIEDALVLSETDSAKQYPAGNSIAELALLWIPEQDHRATADTRFDIVETDDEWFVAEVEGYTCACNFSNRQRNLPKPWDLGGAGELSIGGPVAVSSDGDSTTKVRLKIRAQEPCVIGM